MRHTKLKTIAATLAIGTVVLTGCKGGGAETSGVGEGTIKLGALMDLSGPFAATGKDYSAGMEIAVDEINADGGVCERKLELETKDHGYDTQKAVLAYDDMRSDVAMFAAVFGSTVTAALKDKIVADQVLAMPVSYSSRLLGVDNFILLGATYDVMAINSLDWAVESGLIKKGDTIGEIYLEGELGESVHEGTVYAAKELGLKLTAHHVKPTDTDLSSQVGDLRRKGAKLVMVSTTGAQTATVAAVAQSSGLNVPIVGAVASWNNSLFETDAADALAKNYYRSSVTVGLDDDESPDAQALTETWKKGHQGEKVMSGTAVVGGYASVVAVREILSTTCDDLSPEAVLAARADVEPFDANGLLPTQDISDPGKPASLESVIERPDRDDLDGVSVEKEPFASELAKTYVAGE